MEQRKMLEILKKWTGAYVTNYVQEVLDFDEESNALVKDGAVIDYPEFRKKIDAGWQCYSDNFYTKADFDEFCGLCGVEEDDEDAIEELFCAWIDTKSSTASRIYDALEKALANK